MTLRRALYAAKRSLLRIPTPIAVRALIFLCLARTAFVIAASFRYLPDWDRCFVSYWNVGLALLPLLTRRRGLLVFYLLLFGFCFACEVFLDTVMLLGLLLTVEKALPPDGIWGLSGPTAAIRIDLAMRWVGDVVFWVPVLLITLRFALDRSASGRILTEDQAK